MARSVFRQRLVIVGPLVLLILLASGFAPAPTHMPSQPTTLNSSICGEVTTATARAGGATIAVLVPVDNSPVVEVPFSAGSAYRMKRIFDPQITPLSSPFDSQEYGLIQNQLAGQSAYEDIETEPNGPSACGVTVKLEPISSSPG